MNFFDVEAPYEISFSYLGNDVKHVLSQPSLENLREFETLKKDSLKLKNNEMQASGNHAAAYCRLYDILAVTATGYSHIPPELNDETWKAKVPPRHKIPCAKVFGEISILTDEEVVTEYGIERYQMTCGVPVVHLKARQNSEHILCSHIFREPTLEDISEYESIVASSRMKVSKKGTNIILFEPVEKLAKLYDRLIEWTQGYTTNDKSVTPVIHKVTTLKEFMRSASEEIEEAAGN